jgi:hypothetical protein
MTSEEKRKVYQQLAAPFPEEAIERTDGRVTGRGYSTTGIKYQYVVNRLNEVVGLGNWRPHREITVREVTTAKGRPAFEAVCDITLELGEWVNGQFVVWAEALADGGHTAVSAADAKKGAFTNSLKKVAAMFGCGKAAYEGTLDDDSVPQEIGDGFTMSVLPTQPQRPAASHPSPAPQGPVQRPVAAPAGHQIQQSRPPPPNRNRLTSKQLSAVWALGRKLGYEQQALRQFVKGKYGSQPEFLTREQASQLIGAMSEQAGNGHAQEQHEPGAEG